MCIRDDARRGRAASVTRHTGQGHGGPAVLRRPNGRASCPGSTHNQRFCTVARGGRVAWERLCKKKNWSIFAFCMQLFSQYESDLAIFLRWRCPRGGVVIKIPHNRALELVLTQTTLPGIFCTIALAPQQKLHSPEGFHRCLDLRPRPTA
jgi:hypothetical protein